MVPIYEYQCDACGHKLEVMQRMNAERLKTCPSCEEDALKKLISKVDFRLKGTGWYETDFKDKGKPESGKDVSEGDGKANDKEGSGDKGSGDKGNEGAKESKSDDAKKDASSDTKKSDSSESSMASTSTSTEKD